MYDTLLYMLRQGVVDWNRWRRDNPQIIPNLRGANLRGFDIRGVDFSGADFSSTDFNSANLNSADLSLANLIGPILRGADFCGTNLSNANFRGADLSGADFSNANLSGADLSGADLSSANLSGADLSLADLGWTKFGDVDLSEVKGLESVRHDGPSTIGIDTIYKSKGNIPEAFLRGAGVPDTMITFMKSLTATAIDFYSCFISHSSQDKPFVERLYADLQAKGVRCWYAPENLQIGEPILAGIDRGIRLHDKLLLVLSEHSVVSRWVEHEVEAALAEELRPDRKTKVLFPIRLDNAVMDVAVDWAYRLRPRHIGDFTHWKEHDAYQKAFERLLWDLKAGG